VLAEAEARREAEAGDASGGQEPLLPPRVLPITCATLPSLVLPGDVIYLGRYLACGAPEMGSLYLEATRVRNY
jgi:hypothetical protein